MKHNRFRGGSGSFVCVGCKKQTRDVNGMNGQLQLCELCQIKAECGNALADSDKYLGNNAWKEFEDCKTKEECLRLLQTLLSV